jgi:glycosyltransferase involved in cell wall biosynthesis
MRVLTLSWEYPPHIVGGLGQHVADLAPALARRDLEMHVVTPMRQGGTSEEQQGKLFIHRAPVATFGSGDFYGEAWQTNQVLASYCRTLIERCGPFDLIHNHDWLTALAARELKHAFRLPLVATIHATERGRGRGSLAGPQSERIDRTEWELTFEAWRVIVCTQYMVQEVCDYFQTPEDKLDVIPNGVNPAAFDELEGEDLAEFRRQYALPHEKIVFHVGRIVHEKGIETLIRSAPRVLAHVPEAKFIIAGRGPELDAMRALVAELHLEHKVLLLGFVPDEDRNRLLKAADCAVFPSLYEPFGIVALEAMAARAPVVASEVGGLREVVQHGETGITIYPGDAGSCAWGIVHTLQHPEWAAMRVANALEKVRTIYNWDVIAGQTLDVYRRVVAERAQVDW